jgi:Transposase DDE domain group 1
MRGVGSQPSANFVIRSHVKPSFWLRPNPAGETNDRVLRLDFDRRLMLQFCGSVVTSDAGLLPYRELDDVLGLTVIAGDSLADARTGRNGRHALVGLFRRSVFGRLGGYEDVNDAERRGMIPRCAGSSAAKRLRVARPRRARWAASRRNGSRWKRTFRRAPIFPVSPTHGEQENSVWNGYYACTCYHPLFLFNQFGDLERCALRPGKAFDCHVPMKQGKT